MRRLIAIFAALVALGWGNDHNDTDVVDQWLLGNAGGSCISANGVTITTASASPPAIQTSATTTQPFLDAPSANTCIVGASRKGCVVVADV